MAEIETPTPEKSLTAEEQAHLNLHLQKSKVLREVMNEILQDNRAEIVRRAAKRLRDCGIPVTDQELE